jgi:hypothetical protein
MSRLKSFKGLIAAAFVISIIISAICYSSKAHTCKVTDFQTVNPVLKSYQSYSKANACKKAKIMCSYYSTVPDKCAVIE